MALLQIACLLLATTETEEVPVRFDGDEVVEVTGSDEVVEVADFADEEEVDFGEERSAVAILPEYDYQLLVLLVPLLAFVLLVWNVQWKKTKGEPRVSRSNGDSE